MDATDVYLDGNQLGQLSNHAFIGKKNLRTLLLNSSSISSLHNHTFSGLKRLLVLHLDRNRLTQLTGYEFEPLESLRELYLQHNRIAAIHEKTFSHLRSLQILRLDGNQLVTYDVAQLAANPYLRLIFLAGNPLSCECQFVRPFRQWLQSNHRIQIEDQESVVCWPLAQPILTSDNTSDTCPEGGSIRLLNPNLNPMMQSEEWWLLMAATFSAALVVLFVGLCLCCCRRQLRLFLFSQCGLRTCYRGEPTDDADKPFDALLVYSAKDDLLVRDSIAGRLERKNYQLCLQHNRTALHHHQSQHHDDDRDLSAAAAASRRLVVILTKSFVETEWGKANVRALLRSTWQPSSSSGQHQQRVIILLPEPRIVREIDADLDLHLLLKHSQLVEWNRRFCWSRLLLALPPPRCPGTLIIPVASSSFGGGVGGGSVGTASVRDYCGSGHQFAVTSSSTSSSSSLMSTPVFSSSMTTTTLLQSGGVGSRQQQQQQQQHHNQHRLIHQQQQQQRQLPTVPETI